jgi:hypothetical protein
MRVKLNTSLDGPLYLEKHWSPRPYLPENWLTPQRTLQAFDASLTTAMPRRLTPQPLPTGRESTGMIHCPLPAQFEQTRSHVSNMPCTPKLLRISRVLLLAHPLAHQTALANRKVHSTSTPSRAQRSSIASSDSPDVLTIAVVPSREFGRPKDADTTFSFPLYTV